MFLLISTNFYEVLDGQWWYIDRNLDLEATKASAQALVIDSIKQGVTTIFDHHASFCEIPGSLMKIAEVTKEFGMRACLCYEVSDRDGEEKSLQSIQENKDFCPAVAGRHTKTGTVTLWKMDRNRRYRPLFFKDP